MSSKIAIYPGSFDPYTNGHADVVEKAIAISDRLIIAIATDNVKASFFSLEERKEIIEQEIAKYNKANKLVTVEVFGGLLVDFAKSKNSTIIIRGLRAISDFEYEFQLSCMNSRLAPTIQTIFLPASESTHFISSRMVKEVARLGGDVSNVVSCFVKDSLHKKFTLTS
ncbi:Phosphopantetheine adenylyltransferase [Candidatus Arcanobacter lacustris]|jgi:pantetheine-phosphate adenylyltransferase|uniref:Phosphopantetheine adenylyltransferase n=1 Tax=Candidatus Arcanibacter lacustris TaxID=1607817 RepID=A0A0F5MMU6_9RICK|nr:Phosphopantetheine adenylyltransferase [Candidatus Arcanobacter lacustris]